MTLTPSYAETQATRRAMSYYHNAATLYRAENYRVHSLDELIQGIETMAPGFTHLFGKSVDLALTNDITETDLENAMIALVYLTDGIPPSRASNVTAFYDALANKVMDWNVERWGRVTAEATVTAVKQTAGVLAGGMALYAALFVGLLALTRR